MGHAGAASSEIIAQCIPTVRALCNVDMTDIYRERDGDLSNPSYSTLSVWEFISLASLPILWMARKIGVRLETAMDALSGHNQRKENTSRPHTS